MNTISSLRPAPKFAPLIAKRAGDPAPSPDLSVIDTPEKAVLVPALNPTALIVLGAGLADSAKNNNGFGSNLMLTLGNTNPNFGLSYSTDDAIHNQMQGMGTLAQNGVQETWTLDVASGALSIEGTIGQSQECLKLVPGADGATHIDGMVGTQEVHETLTLQTTDGSPALVWDGTVGGEKVHQEMSFQTSDGKQGFHVTGSLGSAPITSDVEILSRDSTADLVGQGNIAGTTVYYQQQMVFVGPNGH